MITGAPIKALAFIVGIFTAIGAAFGAMNTMYAQVSARTREIGTLRAIGFSRRSILVVVRDRGAHALLLSAGALGVVFTFLAFNLFLTAPTGTMNFRTFSEVLFNFRMTPAAHRGRPGLRARHGRHRRILPGGARGAPEDHDGPAGGALRRLAARGGARGSGNRGRGGGLGRACRRVTIGDLYAGGTVNLAPADTLEVRLVARAQRLRVGRGVQRSVDPEAGSRRAAPGGAVVPSLQGRDGGQREPRARVPKPSDAEGAAGRLFRVLVDREGQRGAARLHPRGARQRLRMHLYLDQGDAIQVRLQLQPVDRVCVGGRLQAPSVLAARRRAEVRAGRQAQARARPGDADLVDSGWSGGGGVFLELVYARPSEKDTPPRAALGHLRSPPRATGP